MEISNAQLVGMQVLHVHLLILVCAQMDLQD